MKLRRIAIILFVTLLGATVFAQDEPAQFDGQLALEQVAAFVNVGERETATMGSITAGNLILDRLEALGWTISEDWHVIGFGDRSQMSADALQTLEYWQPFGVSDLLTAEISELSAGLPNERPIAFDPLIIPVRNLVGSYGSGSTIIIGAHYDSRIFADHDTDAEKHLDPMPGANDGGSGVGVLLELARVISQNYTANNEIRLVFFDAEDNGHIEPWASLLPATSGFIIGSALYASGLNLEQENIEFMLLVDMVGDTDQQMPIESYSNQSAPEIAAGIWATAADLGYAEQFITTPRSPITDDHLPFIQRGIPSVDIIDLDYPYWHTTEDTIDKVSPESLERVGRTLIAYLEQTGAITPNN
ncbi:MAG: M28 family peptidase [Anaerolineae bacterium]|nr:M28 family peptidase [Anaerolineae bacterium]